MSVGVLPPRTLARFLHRLLLTTTIAAACSANAADELPLRDIEEVKQDCVAHDESNFDQINAASPPQRPANESLRIGVRKYAGPFSFHSERAIDVWSAAPQAPLAKAGYTGYMSKICDAVLADMLLNKPADLRDFDRSAVEVVDIDCLIENRVAADGTGILEDGASISRFEYLGKQIDVLCDPATITNERRHDFILSPPLFLSGIGMISRSNNLVGSGSCPKEHLIGQVASTTASKDGLIKVLESNELNSWSDLLKSYIKEGIGRNSCSTAIDDDVELVKLYNNHKAASEAFCNDEFHYYLGDREIITFNARSVAGCSSEIEGAGQTYSFDRYAIYGKMAYRPYSQKRDQRIARFFELLSQKVLISPSLLDTAYQNTFLENPSPKLEGFYWSIRGPK